MDWNTFSEDTQFEKLVFDLTKKSLELVQASSLPEKNFGAFAFNCSSYSGDITLSFGVNPGYEDEKRKIRLYPPDWEHEVIQDFVKEVGELWREKYEPVREKYEEARDSNDESDGDSEEFCNGFLVSLRRVMVRLEKEGLLKNMWVLVTEIDADTEEEERLLQQARESYA
jgi:hypothetical protein